jgi:hypothetical protein
MSRRFFFLLSALSVLCGYSVSLVAQNAVDRSKPPALGAPPQLNLPPIQKRMLSNGLPVWLIEAHEVPLVQINLVLKAGAGDDPVGKFGLASLTAAMLDEGAGKRTALQLADEVEFLGAALTTNSSFDASAVRLNVPVSRVKDALPLMADVVLRPTFPEDELNRVRQEADGCSGPGRSCVGGAARSRGPCSARCIARHRRRGNRPRSRASPSGSQELSCLDVSARQRRPARGRRRDRGCDRPTAG